MLFSTLGDLLHRSGKPADEDYPGEVAVTVPVPPEEVFDVLSDGWCYGLWVVGASHIRDVEDGWPAVGSRIHHGVGPWPLTLHDYTEVVGMDKPRLLELRARSWPLGVARVRLDLRPDGNGGTEIRMAECASEGPGRVLPGRVQYLMLAPRNRESLQRLADIVVSRSSGSRDRAGTTGDPGGRGGDAPHEPG